MATGKSSRSKMSGGRKFLWVLALLFLIMLAAFIWNYGTVKGYSKLGSAYMARVTCSCRYVADRPLDDCQKDREPGTEIVSLSDDPENKRVIASVPFMAEAAAEFRGLSGCVMLSQQELDDL